MKKKLLIIHFDEPEMAYESHCHYDYIIVVFDDGKFLYTREGDMKHVRNRQFSVEQDLTYHIKCFAANTHPIVE